MKLRPIDKVWVGGGRRRGRVHPRPGWFFLISPQKSQTSDLKSQIAPAQTRNQLLQSKLSTLRQQSKNLDQYKATLTRDQPALPSTSGLPDFLRDVQSLGGQTQVNVSSVTIGAPAPLSASGASRWPPTPTVPRPRRAAPRPARGRTGRQRLHDRRDHERRWHVARALTVPQPTPARSAARRADRPSFT